ncbi:MAG: GntP family permease [Opitutaceae bacterium]
MPVSRPRGSSLVPPTPGPLYVAGALGVDLGAMILGGLFIGAITTAVGVAYAFWANRRWPCDVSEVFSEAIIFTEKPDAALPPLALALLPIVLPMALVAGGTLSGSASDTSGLAAFFHAVGNPNIALTIATAVALATLAWTRRADPKSAGAAVQRALVDAGVIILITSAGGVFGGMLQDANVGGRIEGLAREFNLAVLPLAFAVTALVRGAQGSATVAMITAVGIFGSFASAETLGFHPVYLALAIGCGSKPFAWMNDSGFWVVCKTTGFSEGLMIRTFSATLTIMGLAGLVVVMLAARLLPFA